MSSFLWVEDFEGEQYRLFAHSVFGKMLEIDALSFPNTKNELRSFLLKNNIFLVTNYAQAKRFVSDQIADVDIVVLDIDLELLGEDFASDFMIVEPMLKQWYGLNSNGLENVDEAEFNEARDQMKTIAGYHLFIDLVMNQRFPRERIRFCSNHANHLTAMNESFGKAKIDEPEIYAKSDQRIKLWVQQQSNSEYIRLRRWIIIACNEIISNINKGLTQYHLPGISSEVATSDNAVNLLQALPLVLPLSVPNAHERSLAFRTFSRILTQDWDKVAWSDLSTLEASNRAFGTVLKTVRNWTSHDSLSLSKLSEKDLAYLFLISIRSCFSFQSDKPLDFELALLKLIGNQQSLNEDILRDFYEKSYLRIKAQFLNLPNAENGVRFSLMVNELRRARKIPLEMEAQYLRLIFWHQLNRVGKDDVIPIRLTNFRSQLVERLCSRIFKDSIGGRQ